jgi:hypothetical protein
MRILLVGAVVFLAAWFTVLRPKAAEVPPATTSTTATTPATTPAATTPEAATKPDTATTTAPDPKPAEVAAIPAEALAKLPKDVARALTAQKTLVLGVIADGETDYRPLADDDRYVRNALRDVNRYDGEVFVKTVPAGKLSEYGAMVNDLGVKQTPSIVVIDSELKGRVLTGYVDRIAINQVIADARGESISPRISDPYLRDLNALCGQYETRINRSSYPTILGRKALAAAHLRFAKVHGTYAGKVAALKTPAKYRSLEKRYVTAIKLDVKRSKAVAKAVKTRSKADDRTAAAIGSLAAWRKLDRDFDAAGLTDCAYNRRS